VKVKIDDDSQRTPGWKYAEYELKGVPLRIAIGKRDVEAGKVELYRRDTGEKLEVNVVDLAETVMKLLQEMQEQLFTKHKHFSKAHTFQVDTYEEFKEKIEQGYVLAHRDGTRETAERIQEETKATIRCIPFDSVEEAGKDMLTGQESSRRVIFAKSY
jgi:prolyl-tRNA synthetase